LKYFIVILFFVLTACLGGESVSTEADKPKEMNSEIISCSGECSKACCLGCKATQGNKKCIILADGSMPCCITMD
tara:strand:- start:549 stop:773 length:225 start_codon:yes stop_codon:yes gene_type:complete